MLSDDPQNRYVLQVVGRRVELTCDRPWGAEQGRSRLVAIAHGASLNSDYLDHLFDQCLDAGDINRPSDTVGEIVGV